MGNLASLLIVFYLFLQIPFYGRENSPALVIDTSFGTIKGAVTLTFESLIFIILEEIEVS